MNTSKPIQTGSLNLVLKTPEDVRAFIEGMTPSEKSELSEDWLALFNNATSADPWVHGFTLKLRSGTGDTVVGSAGFKGPPADGAVEIAYAIDTAYRGRGYATEAAQALVGYAFGDERVRIVRAHTLPEPNASTRVLTKCGFERIGEVTDPEDGPVWRWEKAREAT